jgi:hypothetical protein
VPEENVRSWKHIIWIPIDAILVFGLPYLLVNLLKFSTDAYYIWLCILSAAFMFYYVKYTKFKWTLSLRPGWALGTIMAVFFGLAFLSLASLARPTVENDFLSAAMLPYLWRGLLYGLASAIFISVFPFLVVWRALAGVNPGTTKKLGVTVAAVLSIALISFLYNLGLADFNETNLKDQVEKSIIASVPTLVSGNPLATPIANVFLQISESVVADSRTTEMNKIETAKLHTTPGGIN